MILTRLPEQNIEAFGEYPFVYYGDTAYSNRDLLVFADRLAVALQAHGVEPGDRVMVCMPNCPEVFFAYQGVMRTGAAVVPVMYLLHPAEIGYIAGNSQCKAIITTAAVLPVIRQAIGKLEHKPLILAVGAGALGAVGDAVHDLYDVLETAAAPLVPAAIEPADLAVILYTSGTTGDPKGVMLTHRNLYSNAAAAVQLALEAGDAKRETTVGVLPLAHIYGLTMANVLYLRGSSVVVLPKFELRALCEAVEKHRVRRFSAVPTMIYSMINDPVAAEYDLSSLETVVCGAAPLPVAVWEEFRARFGAEIQEGYGLSEAAPTVAVQRRGEPVKPGSVGRPYPGVEVRVVDEQGIDLPVGDVGELLVRGENVTPGYFRNEAATREVLRDGWLHTGDLARVDDEGYLYIVDRKKDLIIRGGFNIYPRDLEEVIVRHPGVAEVAVVGAPCPRLGEEVVAFVVRQEGWPLEERELIEYCQEQLAQYKTPRRVVFIDVLPRNGVGKILKKDLRRTAALLPLAPDLPDEALG